MKSIFNQKGLSLIVAVVMMLILAVVSAMLVSLVSNDSDMALYQFRSIEATYIANGGMQYTMLNYPNFSAPAYSTRGAGQVTLGSGGFVVDPPGVLSAAITNVANTIPVVCFDRGAVAPCGTVFPDAGPGAGRVLIESELITFTGISAACAAAAVPCTLTGATRGVDGSRAVDHAIDRAVHHATGFYAGVGGFVTFGGNLYIALNNPTDGFVLPGTLKIDQEYVYCTGAGIIFGISYFSGCTRGVLGSQAVTHNELATIVQPTMTVNATVPTGITGNAQRIIKGEANVYLDGWAAANGGTITRWNGINWNTFTSPVGTNLNSNFLFDSNSDGAADDGWAVGDPSGGEVILRWNGAAWVRVGPAAGLPDTNMNSVYCVAANDCWAVGNNWGGGGGVLAGETILRWNGGPSWVRLVPSAGIPNVNLNSVYCVATNDCWAVGNDVGGAADTLILRWDGVSWVVVDPAGAGDVDTNLNSVYCMATNDCWAVGNTNGVRPTVIRWNTPCGGGAGTNLWNDCTSALFVPTINQNLNSVFMVSAADGWAVGNQIANATNGWMFLRWNSPVANRWNQIGVNTPGVNAQNLNAVHCNSLSDCWAAGNGGRILHWNGINWSLYPSPTGNQLNGIFLLRPTNFLRIGDWQEVY